MVSSELLSPSSGSEEARDADAGDELRREEARDADAGDESLEQLDCESADVSIFNCVVVGALIVA